jgi:hypothetical protein
MHEHNIAVNGWPTVPVGSFRIVGDQVPNVAWNEIEPSRGHYDWSQLDALINRITPHSVDIVYTFRKMPPWASSRPTGSCGKGSAGTCYRPADHRDWKNFVGAITQRYREKIKYWELWNEPNAPNFWSGTAAELVTLASEAYPIIKANNGIVLSPSPQGPSADKWMTEYLDAGGGTYADVIAFHGYVGADNVEVRYGSLIDHLKIVMSKHVQGTKELWDTEHSWGRDVEYPDQDLEASWLARHELVGFARGLQRSFWYAWSDSTYGTLYGKDKHTILPAGIAYEAVYDWLNGARFTDACSSEGTIWICSLILADGTTSEAIWDSSKTCSGQRCTSTDLMVTRQWTEYRDISGSTHSMLGHRVPVGIKPVLLTAPVRRPGDAGK